MLRHFRKGRGCENPYKRPGAALWSSKMVSIVGNSGVVTDLRDKEVLKCGRSFPPGGSSLDTILKGFR